MDIDGGCVVRAEHGRPLRHPSSTTKARNRHRVQEAILVACASGMATRQQGRAFASLAGPCGPLGRLRSRGSDTWVPRDHGTTSISGFPQPVKSWHMVISILCVDVCNRDILQHQLDGQGL